MKRTARVNVKIAFVPLIPEGHTEEYWWPALVYQSYAEAMADRRDTLSSSTTDMMVLKLAAEHKRNYGPGSSGPPSSAAIAQFLGFDDKWSEFTQHRNAFAYVRTAVAQKIKMPSQCLHAFNLALEQAEDLIECDATDTTRIASVLKNTTFVDPNMQQQTDASEMTRATPTPAASPKSAVSGTTRIWGRKKQAPKKEHHSACIKKDKHKNRAQFPKRKAPTAAEHVSAAKGALQESSATANRQRHGGALSKKALSSEEEFYLFKNVWQHFKELGWKWEKPARNYLHDWYYIRPGKDHKTGICGTDYFCTEEEVVAWAKSVNFRKQKGVETTDEESSAEEEDCDEHSCGSRPDVDVHISKDEDTLCTRTRTKDDESCRGDESSRSNCSTPTETGLSFSKVWKHLFKSGWDLEEARKHHPGAVVTWYFVRPNVRNLLTAKRGRDYFETMEEVMIWVDYNPHVLTGMKCN